MRTATFSQVALSCLQSRQRDSDKKPGMSTLHFLEKVLATPDCNACRALQANGLRTSALLDTLTRFQDRGHDVEAAVRLVMARALEMAEKQQRMTVGTEHLLLALFSGVDSRAGFVLKQLGLSADAIEESVKQLPAER